MWKQKKVHFQRKGGSRLLLWVLQTLFACLVAMIWSLFNLVWFQASVCSQTLKNDIFMFYSKLLLVSDTFFPIEYSMCLEFNFRKLESFEFVNFSLSKSHLFRICLFQPSSILTRFTVPNILWKFHKSSSPLFTKVNLWILESDKRNISAKKFWLYLQKLTMQYFISAARVEKFYVFWSRFG